VLYPAIEPFDTGVLDVGNGHTLYWEASGEPDGLPAVVLHGGPGSGCAPWHRRLFDPAAYRIIVFDQRGCGRSRPHASDPATDLSDNTTDHLLADLEALRRHLGIERWVVLGHSWGSTLALAYAERHTARVRALVLVAVTTSRRSEIDWLYGGVAPLFPEEWEAFRSGAPEAGDGTGHDLVVAYHRRLEDPDAEVRRRAAADFNAWDWAVSSLDRRSPPPAGWLEPRFQLARARLATHYFAHDVFLDDGVLLRNAPTLANVPGLMVHGRLDLGSPLANAWALARAWGRGELVVVDGAGHGPSDGAMADAVVGATDGFRLTGRG